MTRSLGRISLGLFFLAGLGASVAWAGPGEFLAEIEAALARGEELRATKAADQLRGYPQSAAYQKAREILLKHGISIETPLVSYSIKQMYAVQNEMEKDLHVTGQVTRIGLWSRHRDAWGTPIRTELIEHKQIRYLVRSAGPDRAFNTEDDLLSAGWVQGKNGRSKKHSAPAADKPPTKPTPESSRSTTMRDVLGGKPGDRTDTRPSPQPLPSTKPGPTGQGQTTESVMDLQDLLKKLE